MTDTTGTAIERPNGIPAALTRPPIIDQLDEGQVKLLAARANAAGKGEVTRGELSAFLELAASYGLDPFAGEVWLAKGSGSKVLIMVGRDGLRKIAQRNGLYVDGDVIHAEDRFGVARSADGTRGVEHLYGHPKDRGPITGAWCEVRDGAGTVRGFYIATVEEFKPKSADALRYSPWGSQESVMILAAAERQALRQATPLAGLVAQGELDRGQETEALGLPAEPVDPAVLDSIPAVRAVVTRAQQVGHAGLANVATVEMQIRDQPEEFVAEWVARATAELDRAEAEAAQVRDADVVSDEDHPEPFLATDPGGKPHARAQELRQQSAEAAVEGDADAAERHLQEAEALEAQGTLGGEGE